jgi:hypothetical protein
MNAENKKYFSLIIWIVALIAIGGIIGYLTKPEISTWYSTLNRSTLTPPNYIFPIAWTILYGIIGATGQPKVVNDYEAYVILPIHYRNIERFTEEGFKRLEQERAKGGARGSESTSSWTQTVNLLRASTSGHER